MLRLLFHVGMAKCGSSSLQKFLFLNHEKLIADGILYLTNNNHNFLIGLIGKNTRSQSSEGLKKNAEKFLINLREYIFNNKVRTVIISSEFLFGLKPSQRIYIYEKVINVLKEKEKEIETMTVVFYRPLFARYLSANMQRLKGYHEIKLYKSGSSINTPSTLDDLDSISHKLKIIPLENVAPDSCLQKAFFQACDIDLLPNQPTIFENLPIINKSLSAESTIALQKWQKYDNPNRENRLTKLTQKFLTHLSLVDSEQKGSKSVLKYPLAETIIRDEIMSFENHKTKHFEIIDINIRALNAVRQKGSLNHGLDSSSMDPLDFRAIIQAYDQELADHIYCRATAMMQN